MKSAFGLPTDAAVAKFLLDSHAGLKWNAMPTDPKASDPPTAEDMDFIVTTIKEEEEELSLENYKQTNFADFPKANQSTPDNAEQFEDSKSDIDAHICISDVRSYADVTGPSVSSSTRVSTEVSPSRP